MKETSSESRAIDVTFVIKGASCLAAKSIRHDKRGIHGKGTVKYLSFEGGFYGIVGDDGKHYDPLNLPAEFRLDGLRIRFAAKAAGRIVSFHMWGHIVELVSIEKLL